jgi:hypothetical protein
MTIRRALILCFLFSCASFAGCDVDFYVGTNGSGGGGTCSDDAGAMDADADCTVLED